MQTTLPKMVLARARRNPFQTALRRKEHGTYREIPWQTVEEQIFAYGRSLLAMGLQPGERVAVMAPNSPEWVYVDQATMACRCASVPVYHTEGMPTVLHIIRDSGSRFLFVHNQVEATALIKYRKDLPDLERIILLQGELEEPWVQGLAEFLDAGQSVSAEDLESLAQDGQKDDLASLVYTSGTTGPPKGVMLTHGNFLSNIAACLQLFDISEYDQCLSFLPLSHVFERMAGYYLMLHQGTVIAYAENFESVPVNLKEVAPTVVVSVPRLYEKMYSRVMERVLAGPWLNKQIFFAARSIGRHWVRHEQSGGPIPWYLQKGIKLARRLVFDKVAEHLGGRLRFFVSGGAPLAPEIAEFFLSAGLPIYEGYGLTETSPVISANYPGHHRIGSVGRPLSNTEIRLSEDGEILVRGPGVFQGYWQSPQETDAAFDQGWFHTGDIGELDEDGFLSITDRKKDLIVTASGENIAPQILENLLKKDKFISNAMVYGDRKPYLIAMLVPNFDKLAKFAQDKKLDFLDHCDLVNQPAVLELVRHQVDALQSDLPSFQRIKRFILLSQDFAGTFVTPTLKIRRKLVEEHFHNILEQMYLPQDHGVHDSGFCLVENSDHL